MIVSKIHANLFPWWRELRDAMILPCRRLLRAQLELAAFLQALKELDHFG